MILDNGIDDMIRGKLQEELARIDSLLAEHKRELEADSIAAARKRALQKEKRRLERYREELLKEWRHFNA